MLRLSAQHWPLLREAFLQSITPCGQHASGLDLLRARAFFFVCWLSVAVGALIGSLLAVDGQPQALAASLVMGAVTLAGLRGPFQVSKYTIIAVVLSSALALGLLTEAATTQRFSLLLLIDAAILAAIALSLVGLIGFTALILGGLWLILNALAAHSPSPELSLSVMGTIVAVLAVRLIWTPLTRAYFQALYGGLSESMTLMQQHTTGFLYRLKVTEGTNFKLEEVFGSPMNTVGHTAEQLIAASGWHGFLHPDDHHLLDKHWRQALALGEHQVEYRLFNHRQRWLWVSDHAVAQRSSSGVRVHGVLRDITDKKQAEADLRAYVLQQAVIAELGMRAIQFETLTQLAEHAALCVEQVLEISGCDIYEHLEATDQMELRGAAGIYTRPERRLSLNDQSLPLRAALYQDYLLLNHIPDAPPYNEHAFFVRNGIQHSLLVSIPGVTQRCGLLAVYRTIDRPFSINEVYFLQSICNILGTFVETQHIRQQQRRHVEMTLALREAVTLIVTEQDLDAVLNRILDSLKTIIPAHDASTLMLSDESGGLLRVVAQRGYDNALERIRTLRIDPTHTGEYDLLLRNQYVLIPDTHDNPNWEHHPETAWIRSYLGAPILIDGQFVGLINLDSQRVNAFTDADGIVLSVFAEKVSVAIRNARRTAELEHLVQARMRDLQSERKRLQTILEATGDGIVYVENGLIRYVNGALCQLTSYSQADLLDQPIANIITGLPNHVDSGRAERCDGSLQCKNDDTVPVELTLSVLQEDDRRMVIVVRDVSARRALEMQQRRFIINAAHELRTPVTNFNTRLYLLEKQPERIADHLPVLKRISGRMNRLVEDLLDSGSIEQGRLVIHKAPTVLQAVLRETVESLQAEAQEKQIVITLTLLPELITLTVDAHRLQQVFTNLIANAINYTPKEGSVNVCQRLEGEYVVVDVIDTGIGIAPQHHQAIFEPFYRVETRQVGTGLGLAISQEIVRMHGGRIRLESELGRGSTFSVLLPQEPVTPPTA